MQKTAILNMEKRIRPNKGANKLLRSNGYLPANIFGKGAESISIAVKKNDFLKSLKEYGRNAVFKLVSNDDEAYTVMAKEIQVAPIVNEIQHLDFQLVSLLEEINQEVAIKYIGTEFLELKRLLLNSHVDSIIVNGLPHDIPHEIEIDVSNMESGESILFEDLKLPDGITADINPEQKIISIKGTRKQEAVTTE